MSRALWIVGVDGSADSEHALRWSISQAEAQSASIRAVRTWQANVAGITEMAYVIEQAPQLAQAALDELAASLGEEASSIEWVVECGSPAWTLLDMSEEAELLVLGTRGAGGFKRLLLGSVSHQCATHAHVPVAVIPTSASIEGRLDQIVVGMDSSDNAKAALAWALDFAPAGATVRVVGVWQPSSLATEADQADFDYLSEPTRERFAEAVEEVSSARETGDVKVESVFSYARAATALLDAGAEADLLVIGARGQGWLKSAILGSVATEVLHHATCPVVVVPKPEGD